MQCTQRPEGLSIQKKLDFSLFVGPERLRGGGRPENVCLIRDTGADHEAGPDQEME
jgi:hypothetical protein